MVLSPLFPVLRISSMNRVMNVRMKKPVVFVQLFCKSRNATVELLKSDTLESLVKTEKKLRKPKTLMLWV